MFSRVNKLDAYKTYLFLSGASVLFFTLVFTVNMVYQVQIVGLTPLQMVLVGTTLEISIFLFEVPTGVVADVYSRRLSIIIGVLMIGLGFIVEGSIPHFEAILLAQALWGLGHTFTSGATEAWITDEIGQDKAGRAFLRASQVGNIVGLAGTVVAVVLGSLLLNLPIILGGTLFLALAIFLMLFMPETGFQPAPRGERTSGQQMGDTLRSGVQLVRVRPILLTILGIGLFYGLYSEGLDRLWTPHLLQNFSLPTVGGFQPVVWIGMIDVAIGLLGIAATQLVIKRVDTTNHLVVTRASLIFSALLVASLLGFALVGSFIVAVVMLLAIYVLRTVIGPIQTTWMNQHVDSSVRATVISMSGQVDALGQMLGGPLMGLIGNTSIRQALVASSLILSPVLLLYILAMRLKQPQEIAPAIEG